MDHNNRQRLVRNLNSIQTDISSILEDAEEPNETLLEYLKQLDEIITEVLGEML